MNLEFIFRKDNNKKWELFGIDVSETKEHLPNRILVDMFYRYNIVDKLFELLNRNGEDKHKTAYATVPYPIEDMSSVMIAYFPMDVDEMYDEMIKEQQS